MKVFKVNIPNILARSWNICAGMRGSGSSLKYSLRSPATEFTSAVLSLDTASRRSGERPAGTSVNLGSPLEG